MPVVGADHTCYTVRNMSASLAFYRDLLGFRIIHERPQVTNQYFRDIIGFPDSVVHAVLLSIPGTDHKLELFQYLTPSGNAQDLTPNNPGSSHMAYHVDDLLKLYEELKSANCHFISEPVYLNEGPNKGGWALYMYDPDRIPIEMFQPPAVA